MYEGKIPMHKRLAAGEKLTGMKSGGKVTPSKPSGKKMGGSMSKGKKGC